MRGSHQMPLMPVPLMSGVSYFDGPPVISGAAMQPMSELEYTGIMEKLERLDTRFQIRRD